jgi:hypothetical protein
MVILKRTFSHTSGKRCNPCGTNKRTIELSQEGDIDTRPWLVRGGGVPSKPDATHNHGKLLTKKSGPQCQGNGAMWLGASDHYQLHHSSVGAVADFILVRTHNRPRIKRRDTWLSQVGTASSASTYRTSARPAPVKPTPAPLSASSTRHQCGAQARQDRVLG